MLNYVLVLFRKSTSSAGTLAETFPPVLQSKTPGLRHETPELQTQPPDLQLDPPNLQFHSPNLQFPLPEVELQPLIPTHQDAYVEPQGKHYIFVNDLLKNYPPLNF